MASDLLMSRFEAAQLAVSGLLQMVRTWRTAAGIDPTERQLLEDGLHLVGHELLDMRRAIADREASARRHDADSLELLGQCQELLRTYEAEAARNGMLDVIAADLAQRPHPAAGYDPGRYEVTVDAAAEVTVVRERPAPSATVIPFPDHIARLIHRAGGAGEGGGR